MSTSRSSIKDRAKLFGGTKGSMNKQQTKEDHDKIIDGMLSPMPRSPKPSGGGGVIVNRLTDKIRGFELGHDSSSSLGESFDHLRYEKDRQQILMQRSGTVKMLTSKLNEQIAANEAAFQRALEEKVAKKKRYRNKKKYKKKHRTSKSKMKNLVDDSVWSNKMATPSFWVDPKTYKPPTKLNKPSPDQESILRQVMKSNVLIKDESVPHQEAYIKAFEPVEIRKGHKLQDGFDDYFYVVQEGELDIERKGKVVATARSGETFGEMNLVYSKDVGRQDKNAKGEGTTLVAKDDVKLLRLKQEDFLGIKQSQAKQEDIDKQEMLRRLPFMNKLLAARDTDMKVKNTTTDVVDRIASVMKPLYFIQGQQLFNEDDDTLYIIKEGNVKLTSKADQQFVLGPGDYIGRQALMGSRGKEPEVKAMEALSSGIAYAIAKSVAEKVLGQNFVSRQTSRLEDPKKLDNFHCIKSVNLDRKTLDTIAESVDDQTFAAGNVIMKQGEQVEPCLYLIREGTVTLASDDGTFFREVGPGGYFGVEKLLVPKNASSDKMQPSKDMKLPAQWNVKVSDNGPCVMGVLSLVDSQEILDNDGKKKEKPLVVKPESKMIVKRKQTSKIVRSTVELDDLEMVNVLGEGAFGEVWLVRTDVNGKQEEFALKKIKKEDEMIASLKREIKFLTSFGFHPFIINLIKVFDRDDGMYMLMSLASGGELWDIVHREDEDGNWTSGIPEKQARFYTFLLADTLAYIHSKKYVYRDLKPENVLIDSDGYPVLIDFGFCKHCPDKTYTCCGTPNYVAPEIITNEGHYQAVDWWALGIVLYEMVSGEHPFYVDGMDQIAVFESVALEDYIPIPAHVSDGVIELVDGFLEKDPTQRLGNLAGREKDILDHPYFDGLDLSTLRSRKAKAPWVPPSK